MKALLALALFAAPSLAMQGSDSCSTPTAIAGQGTFAYDNTLATTGAEGQNEAVCYKFGSSAVDNDVWFAWTADFTGNAEISTCGGTSDDSKIGAYSGSACPTTGTALDCNDDTCGLQSSILIPVTSGSTYMVRVLSTLDREKLKPNTSVALHRHSHSVVDTLPPEADSSVQTMMSDEKPDVTYEARRRLRYGYVLSRRSTQILIFTFPHLSCRTSAAWTCRSRRLRRRSAHVAFWARGR